MMEHIIQWVRHDDSGLGREKLAGNSPVSTLAVPMMILCLIDQLTVMDPALDASYSDTETWCLQEVQKHVQVGCSIIVVVEREGRNGAWEGGSGAERRSVIDRTLCGRST